MSRRRPTENEYCLTPSTGNSRLRVQESCCKVPETPSRLCRMSAQRSRLQINAATERGTDLGSSPKWSMSSSNVTPRSLYPVSYKKDIREPLLQQSATRSMGDENGQSSLDQPIKESPRPRHSSRGRNLIRKDNLGKAGRNEISSKIERLYRAKTMERLQDAVHGERSNVPAQTSGRDNRTTGNAPADSDFGRYLRKKSSKVAAMTKFFDSGSVAQPLLGLSPPRQQQIFSKTSPFVEKTENLNHGGVRKGLPPTLPPLPSYHLFPKIPSISPKTVQESIVTYDTSNSPIKPRATASVYQASPEKRSTGPRGRSINEKVQLFENVRARHDTGEVRKRSGFVRKLSRSLKSLFEPSTRRNEEQINNERSLDGDQLKEIFDEFQDTSKPARLGKRTNTFAKRWNAVPLTRLANGCDGALSEKGIGSPSAAGEVREMVVKEAECGLKEPKPVRVVEVKRMMLICKERFGKT